jgi:hypothetical protein
VYIAKPNLPRRHHGHDASDGAFSLEWGRCGNSRRRSVLMTPPAPKAMDERLCEGRSADRGASSMPRAQLQTSARRSPRGARMTGRATGRLLHRRAANRHGALGHSDRFLPRCERPTSKSAMPTPGTLSRGPKWDHGVGHGPHTGPKGAVHGSRHQQLENLVAGDEAHGWHQPRPRHRARGGSQLPSLALTSNAPRRSDAPGEPPGRVRSACDHATSSSPRPDEPPAASPPGAAPRFSAAEMGDPAMQPVDGRRPAPAPPPKETGAGSAASGVM